MNEQNAIWFMGQFLSIGIGVSMGFEFSSVTIGFGIFYGLSVLVDIRRGATP